jgi:U3 small nucleolar RNA-associated protein 25
MFSAFITPELNALFSQHCHNVYGKVKFSPEYPGAILSITRSGLQIKQTFSRFVSTSISCDPEQRFKFFTSSVIPSLTRYPAPPDGARGILIFIPSYFDFVRVRNYFATSSATQNISFGAISENSTPQDKDVRRARSHFLSGRHAVLLYSGRAHHFFRYRLRGVKRLVCYGLPDSDAYYQELVGMVGRSVEEGKVAVSDGAVRVLFSKYDALKLERVAGSSRVGSMLKSKSDTFQFT